MMRFKKSFYKSPYLSALAVFEKIISGKKIINRETGSAAARGLKVILWREFYKISYVPVPNYFTNDFGFFLWVGLLLHANDTFTLF
jgi:hypothetical protein